MSLPPIKLELLFNGIIRVLEDYPFTIYGDDLVVPKGFETDFASIPWGMRNLIPKVGKYSHAAVLHDYLCALPYNKKKTDDFFMEVMEQAGVPWWKRKIIYRGVRLYSPFRKGE